MSGAFSSDTAIPERQHRTYSHPWLVHPEQFMTAHKYFTNHSTLCLFMGSDHSVSLESCNLVVDWSLHELVRSHVLLDLWQTLERIHEGRELGVGVQNTRDHQPVLVEELVHGEIRHRHLTDR